MQKNIALLAIMNLEHIKIFLEVFQTGSFVAVAKERDVAASSITRAISGLEERLKTRLFHRSTRSLSPTEAGKLYYLRMKPIMEAFTQAHESVKGRSLKPSGNLRVTTSVSYGQIVVAPKLKKFREQYPDIQLELILTDSCIDLISEQIDVAIRHGQLPDSSLTARKLNEVSYFLVASPDYLKASPTLKQPQDLDNHQLINFPYKSFRYDWCFERDGIIQHQPINPILTISNANMIRQCAASDMGLALLADWTVAADLQAGSLVRILPQWTIYGRERHPATWIVYPSRRFIPEKTRAFVDFLAQN